MYQKNKTQRTKNISIQNLQKVQTNNRSDCDVGSAIKTKLKSFATAEPHAKLKKKSDKERPQRRQRQRQWPKMNAKFAPSRW